MSVSRKHRGLVPLLVGGLLAGGPAEAGCIRFAAAKSFPTLVQQPDGILVTDLDGDGRADIVVSDSQFGELETRLGRGDGTFRVGTGLVDVSEVTGGLAAGDLDGDGRADLAVAMPLVTADGGYGTAILLNRGVNRFHQKGLPARQEVTDLALADLNGDGRLDLLLAEDDHVEVRLGTGAGNFSWRTRVPAHQPGNIVVADLNGDRRLDLATPTFSDGALLVALGRGDGTFGEPRLVHVAPGSTPSIVVAADLDGDGRIDLAVTDTDKRNVAVLLGRSGGSFAPPTYVPTDGKNPYELTVADFDRDGHPDIAVSNSNSGTVAILPGLGHGLFGKAHLIAARAGGLAARDLDGDGLPDLVVTDSTAATVSAFRNRSGCRRGG